MARSIIDVLGLARRFCAAIIKSEGRIPPEVLKSDALNLTAAIKEAADPLSILAELGRAKGVTLYDIHCRRGGWAVCWWEPDRCAGFRFEDPNDETWKKGLVVHFYSADPVKMIANEVERLSRK